MQICTEGVVLKVRDVDEADRVLTILTRDRGVITAFANGAKRLKSKLMAATQTFNYSGFQLYKGKDHYTVDSAETLNVFYGIRNDIDSLSLAGYLCELTQCLAPEEDEAEGYLRLLLNSMHFLNTGTRSVRFIKPLYELRILSLAGYMPNLVCCESCSCYEAAQMYFLLRSAKLLCADCAKSAITEPYMLLPPAVLTAMRYIIYSEFNKLFNFTLADESLSQLARVCEAYLLCQVGHGFKSLDFLNSLSPANEGEAIV
ncbi:DNA repair protein RecO [Acetanaerobacterium elongatum]|uniref:DNA repair protein RecO n=1 Tax=Acetanaerobacterium elongatum TaxID=258515 RepID=A0A1H0A2R1_9FIRM|nr:DNA repair protein RecO [Acetanaerobacterium elongatum]SDN27848.1 DNA replication and repair protein RecO [Acetanaerobacterium elongatum]